MIIDNLTIAGLLVTALFALMPIMMGREFVRVRDDASSPAEKPMLNRTEDRRTVTAI